MKKNTILPVLYFSIFLSTLISCEAETDFEVLAVQEPIRVDNSNFFPASIIKAWEYSDAQGNSAMVEPKEALEVNGEKFYEINQFDNGQAWVRKSGSTYEIRLEGDAIKSTGYTTIGTYYKGFLFDHNAEAGTQWETIASYTVSFVPNEFVPARPAEDYEAVIKSELVERDLDLKVNGITYDNVIKVKVTITAIGKTKNATYYFADNVGIIQYSEGIFNYKLSNYTFVE